MSRSRQAALLVALAVALWVAGTLGLVHRTVHVPGAPHATVTAQQASAGAETLCLKTHEYASSFTSFPL